MTANLAPHLVDALERALFVRDRAIRPGPVPADVLAYFRAKKLRPRFSHHDVYREEHDHSFTAAKVMRLDVLEALQDELARAVSQGVPFERWKRQIEPRMQALGWWEPHEVEDPDTGDVAVVDPPRRLKTIYETNLRSAHAVGQHDRLVANKRTVPYWLYGVGPSARHREQHVAWAGLLLPVDDPFWDFAFPPNGWGCKCHVRGVSKVEYSQLVKKGVLGGVREPELDDDGTPTGHWKTTRIPVQLKAPQLPMVAHQNKRTGELVFAPEGIDPGFDKRPGEGRKLVRDEGKRRVKRAQKRAGR